MEDLEKTKEDINQTEEKGTEVKKEKVTAGRKRRVRRAVVTAILVAILAFFVYFAVLLISIKSSSSPVGYWVIKESTSGGVTMTQEDAEAIGLTAIGSIRLDESGDCKVIILDEEYEGKWTRDDEGTITINYGEEKILTATIDDEGKMTAQDDKMMEYTLEK